MKFKEIKYSTFNCTTIINGLECMDIKIHSKDFTLEEIYNTLKNEYSKTRKFHKEFIYKLLDHNLIRVLSERIYKYD